MNWRALPGYKWLEKRIGAENRKEVTDRGGSITDSEKFNQYVKKGTKIVLVIYYVIILMIAYVLIRGWFV